MGLKHVYTFMRVSLRYPSYLHMHNAILLQTYLLFPIYHIRHMRRKLCNLSCKIIACTEQLHLQCFFRRTSSASIYSKNTDTSDNVVNCLQYLFASSNPPPLFQFTHDLIIKQRKGGKKGNTGYSFLTHALGRECL